jgi:hypothetical protein
VILDAPPFQWRYFALYEVETEDLNHTLTALKERAANLKAKRRFCFPLLSVCERIARKGRRT